MSLRINERATIERRVTLLWPKPDTRIPEAQRPKPVLDGHVDCDYVYHSQEDAERLDAQVEAGDLTHQERFERLVTDIRGLPIADGESPHNWLNNNKYGAVVRTAIWEDYLLFLGEGRQGNSKKRR